MGLIFGKDNKSTRYESSQIFNSAVDDRISGSYNGLVDIPNQLWSFVNKAGI